MPTQRETSRFAPNRAGIINLWDYRDEEFVFIDGWLVLRGPNGSGKTKALEVLFPFVLDGRIEPRRLNPFASEDRTMKSNLLYRGQEVAYAYVWMEFRRPYDDTDQFVTAGIGLRAHRHVDKVTRWHFVVDGRVGVDFSLIDGEDRPLNKRDLIGEIGAEQVYDSPEDYRKAVDARLFGLGPNRYEQMLELVLTLRKPQLAKDLNPVDLSRLLQRGLRPLDEALVGEAAGSFDDMEAVVNTLRGLMAADQATSAFLSVYSTYLRTHAKSAADTLTSRRAAVQHYQSGLSDATAAVTVAKHEQEAAVDDLTAADGEPGRLRAHLDRLKSSPAYQSHEQLADVERHVQDLAKAAAKAQQDSIHAQSTVDKRARELAEAESATADATSQINRLGQQLREGAEMAGLSWSIEDADPQGFTQRVSARATARRDDVRAVRERANRLAQAERDRAKAAQDAADAAEEAAKAERAESEAEASVAAARRKVCDDLVSWSDRHDPLLRELGVQNALPALTSTTSHTGEPAAQTLREAFDTLTEPGLVRVRQTIAQLEARRDELGRRHAAAVAERDRIAAEHDDAPAASPYRPADRTDRSGAPLWRLVRFAEGVPEAGQANVEAALQATGLLDVWIHPDPALTAEAEANRVEDGYFCALPVSHRPERSLAELLAPERQPDVPTGVIGDVLASIALTEGLPPGSSPAAVTTDGQYALGVLLGAFTKPRPEYIGATARATRRAARIHECEQLIAGLEAELATIEARRNQAEATMSTVDSARRALPPTYAIVEALRQLDQAATTLRIRRQDYDAARSRLDQAIAEHSAATSALRRVTAERSLPADRVDAVADAVSGFETTAVRMDQAGRDLAKANDNLAAAGTRHAEATDTLEQAQEHLHHTVQAHEEKHVAWQTLSAAIGADVQDILDEVADTETKIGRAETRLGDLRERAAKKREALAAANAKVEAAGAALHIATAEAQHDALGLRPFAHPDLLGLLRCATDLRWPATSDASGGTRIRPEILALHEAILAATKELTPTEVSLKQSTTRLTSALTELQTQLPATGLDHRPEFDHDDNVIVVRIADEQGLTPVAFFAQRIAQERQDQEQLLSDAERRILEDALLTQLARQIHHRTIEARDLVERMDAQMRARRMSSGMTVGVGWQLADDLDPEQREVCKLLDRDPARLGPVQLAMMRGHFATRIKAARAAAPEQPYRDLLAQVLDYRQWRVFAFTLHRPGASSEALTRARHSQLSGGEQSVSLHLPLFAAANALLSSARTDAPRMLGLDEAFAGVDDTGRRELMSLATQFDLDLFMTGYDLWATHPGVTGAAHYDLSHSAVEHAVSTVLLAWNGSFTTADFDGTLPRALGSPETRRIPHTTSGVLL